ncbi:MAG: hypothetical protein ACP5QA_15650 [Phycisphaerae bacterium]
MPQSSLTASLPQSLFLDANAQNKHSANAGDGPKHIAWLTIMRMLADLPTGSLKSIVETHSGGGIYAVAPDSFCLNLPPASILARHQAAAQLSPRPDGTSLYSASGDQALLNMPADCNYFAYDINTTTAQRLAAVAAYRNRTHNFTSINHSCLDQTARETSLATLLHTIAKPALIMSDPFDLADLATIARVIAPICDARTIMFGVAKHGDPLAAAQWQAAIAIFSNQHRIQWLWQGTATPAAVPTDTPVAGASAASVGAYLFYLLIAVPTEQEQASLYAMLLDEHKLLAEARTHSHSYTSTGPHCL